MSYRQNRTKTRVLISSLIVVVLIAIVYFAGSSISRGLSSFFNAVSFPILKTGQNIEDSVDISGTLFSSKRQLLDENKKLRDLLETSQLKLLSKELLFAENKELKGILDRSEYNDIVLGTVLARPNQSLYDTLIIDIGYDDEVEVGDKVLVSGEVVIGEIVRVHKNSSVVQLFSSSGKRTNVLIGDEHIAAVAKGRGGMNFSIELPRDLDISEGDIIEAPDINVQVLGEVGFVNKDASSPFQTILFTGPVNIQHLKWVEVIKSQSDRKEQEQEDTEDEIDNS